MIGKLKNICKDDICLIENYELALNDKKQIWECHHRLETDLNMSRQQLIDIKRYYNVPASELIFLTRTEYNKIHKTGTHHSEKTKQKMSKSANREPRSEETKNLMKEKQRNRIKQPMKGKHHSEETKRLMSKHRKGEKNPCYGRTKEKHPLYGKHWRLENGKRIYYTI